MTAIAAAVAHTPDHCQPLSVGHRRLNIPPALVLGGRDASHRHQCDPLLPGLTKPLTPTRRSDSQLSSPVPCPWPWEEAVVASACSVSPAPSSSFNRSLNRSGTPCRMTSS